MRLARSLAATRPTGTGSMAPGAIKVEDSEQYVNALAKAHVVVDIHERRRIVEAQLGNLSREVGGRVVRDPDLIEEVVQLTEDPWGQIGHIEPLSLELPREVLLTSMRNHQRYFAVEDEHGRLMPYFIRFNIHAGASARGGGAGERAGVEGAAARRAVLLRRGSEEDVGGAGGSVGG